MVIYAKPITLCLKSITFKSIDDIFKTTLIYVYAEHQEIDIDLNVFDSVNDNKKDIDIIGSMIKALEIYDKHILINDQKDVISYGSIMKGLIDNEQNQKVLELYHGHDKETVVICHILAVQACINLEDKDNKIKMINMNNLMNLEDIL